ncbi:MAG: response regulator [Planctomycetota bacterium]|jgi:two-component system KDP operon response regulator KdpE|nr:response regulator [Planctomycetota bacterium]
MARTILLVDKEPLFVEQTRQRFLSQGYRVLCARTQAEAERIIASTRPDIVVTEVVLDRQDGGFCLAWEVKKRYPDVPVVIVSSVTWHTGLYFNLSTPEDRNWIKADVFIDKPIRAEELDSAISDCLNRKATKTA